MCKLKRSLDGPPPPNPPYPLPHPPLSEPQEALAAYTEAQRLDSSTDEALEQAERVRALIASGGVTESSADPTGMNYSAALPSTLPQVAEEEEEVVAAAAAAAQVAKADAEAKEATAHKAAKAAEEASRAAVAATAAAERAAALISPAKRSPTGAAQGFMPAAIALGREGSAEAVGGGDGVEKPEWGHGRSQAERDSDSMSVDTNLSTQALLPVGLR